LENSEFACSNKIKNAVSYSGASSTVGDPVLFECTVDCLNFNKFP